MRIIQLHAENVKRLRAVEIHPDPHVQVVTGRNAQGKTSVLDAIWFALGGGAASRSTLRPVRNGAEQAEVTLDLGELRITRRWDAAGRSALKVESADGARFPSPQAMLDRLVGRLSFDPLEFTRLSARDQLAALLALVHIDIDLEDNARERAALYEARTEVGRDGRRLEGQLAGLELDPTAPAEEVSSADLLVRIRDAERLGDKQAREVERRQRAASDVRRLEEELAAARQVLTGLDEAIAGHVAVPDVAALEVQLQEVEATNAAVRRNRERARVHNAFRELRENYSDLTRRIEALDAAKAAALAAAEFPVDGLGFDDAGVTYQGVPFSQASAAEQIRVSLAMAMALNPELRVIRILDGSLLDADNLALITQMAVDNDYQVWIERVADGSGVGVVIEDGQVLEPILEPADEPQTLL